MIFAKNQQSSHVYPHQKTNICHLWKKETSFLCLEVRKPIKPSSSRLYICVATCANIRTNVYKRWEKFQHIQHKHTQKKFRFGAFTVMTVAQSLHHNMFSSFYANDCKTICEAVFTMLFVYFLLFSCIKLLPNVKNNAYRSKIWTKSFLLWLHKFLHFKKKIES